MNYNENKRTTIKQRILQAAKWAWIFLVLLGAGYYFYQRKTEVLELIQTISLPQILISALLLLLGELFIALLIHFSIRAEGFHQPFIKTVGLYGTTALGKYIPGGVWHFLGRIGIYKLNNLSNKQIMRAFILENYWLLSSALFVGLESVCLFRFELIVKYLQIPNLFWVRTIICTAVFALWVISLWILHIYINKYTKEQVQQLWIIVLVGITLWVTVGLSFYVLFPKQEFQQAGIYIGGYSLSWAVGYIAVFAPGGIGIRESVLALVFSNIMPVTTMAVYSTMNRIIWLTAELIYGLVGFIQKRGVFPAKTRE